MHHCAGKDYSRDPGGLGHGEPLVFFCHRWASKAGRRPRVLRAQERISRDYENRLYHRQFGQLDSPANSHHSHEHHDHEEPS